MDSVLIEWKKELMSMCRSIVGVSLSDEHWCHSLQLTVSVGVIFVLYESFPPENQYSLLFQQKWCMESS